MSKSLLNKGTAVDMFLKALLVDKNINLDDLIIGDKNALIYAARILAYGYKYQIQVTCPSCNTINKEVIVDLQNDVKNK
jgi:hypothetical protein